MVLWTPSSITTALWLDAADSDTITLNSGNVSRWDDKSGNARHVSQGIAGMQPAYTASAINGLHAVRFSSSAWNRLTGTRPADVMSIYVVMRRNTSEAIGIIYGDTSSTTTRWLAAIENSAGAWQSNVSSSSLLINGTSIASPTRATLYNALNGKSTLLEMFGNFSTWGGSFALGGYFNASSVWDLKGDIGEVVIQSGTSTVNERQLIEGYLAHKWGLEANLPATHPYIMAAPTNYEFQYDPYLFSAEEIANIPTNLRTSAVTATTARLEWDAPT